MTIKETKESPLESSKTGQEKPKSWASILKSHTSAIHTPKNPSILIQESFPSGILDFKFNFESQPIVPRGMVNSGNMCFMNSILQPLVHCPPFYNFFVDFARKFFLDSKQQPLLSAFSMFLNEFNSSELDLIGNFDESPLTTEVVFDALYQVKKFDTKKGRQEDAQEFLGFLLDGLEQELLDFQNKKQSEVSDLSGTTKESKEWIEIGSKNKPKRVIF